MTHINMNTFDTHYTSMIEIIHALHHGTPCEFRNKGSLKWMEFPIGQDPNFKAHEYRIKRIKPKIEQRFRVAQMYNGEGVKYLKFFYNDIAANNTEKASPNFICWITDWITYDE